MDFAFSTRCEELREQLLAFMDRHVYEQSYWAVFLDTQARTRVAEGNEKRAIAVLEKLVASGVERLGQPITWLLAMHRLGNLLLDAGREAEGRAMLELYHDQMARALAHLINILDPHAIVLGGGMSNIGSIYEEVPKLLPDYVFSEFVATPILPAERGAPLALGNARFVDTDFVGECGLERPLPVVLEFLQAVLETTACIAHPAKRFAEESTHVVYVMIIQTVDHGVDRR